MPIVDIDILKSYFNKKNVPRQSQYENLIDSMYNGWGNAISGIQWLPRLRIFIPPASLNLANQPLDFSLQGHILTPTSSVPSIGIGGRLSTYFDFVRANSQAYYEADTPNLSFTSYLTLLTWVQFDSESSGNSTMLISKAGASGSRSYMLFKWSDDRICFNVAPDGVNYTQITDSGNDYTTSEWLFVCSQFKPSSAMNLWIGHASNGVFNSYTNTTSIPSAIHDNGSEFCIGAYMSHSLDFLDGRMSLIAAAASGPEEYYIENIFRQTRPLFM